jgi:hypothetical protein
MNTITVTYKKTKKMNPKSFKTKVLGSALLLSLSLFTLKAQQTRAVGDFTGIRAGDALKIIITQSDTPSIKVNAPEDMLQFIKTEVNDAILTISTEGNMKDDQNITVFITVKSLNSLENSGVAEIKSGNKLTCETISITSQGVGDINLMLDAKEIKTNISGTGDVTLTGTTQSLDAKISGTGNLKASNLEADKVTANVSGTGDAKVYATQSLNANVSGAGSIIYKGNPVDRTVDISGVGSVRESKSGNGEETASDTTKIKWGNKKYMIIDQDDDDEDDDHSDRGAHSSHNSNFKYWKGFSVGVNGYLDHKGSLDIAVPNDFLELNYAKSIQFSINAFQKNFHIYKNYVNIYTGLGIDFNHYALENNVTLKPNVPYLAATVDSAIDYKKNTLNVTYLKVPLMLEINTSRDPDHNFHIALGAELDYRIHAVTKQSYEMNDKKIQVKRRDDYNLEPFSYSAVARIGYNNVSVYANYGFSRLFRKDKGPQVYPFSVGITVTI